MKKPRSYACTVENDAARTRAKWHTAGTLPELEEGAVGKGIMKRY